MTARATRITRKRGHRRRPGRGHPRGYVLLVTLGLLVLSTTLLVAVGRAAVKHSALANLEQQQLQRKWASLSCRSAVLPYAEQILSTAEGRENRPMPSVQIDVRLGNVQASLVISDEQAKANVNEMLARYPIASVENRLRQGLSGTPAFAHVRLRPPIGPVTRQSTTTNPSDAPRITGFGQIFDDASPSRLFPASANSPSSLDTITCWGDGQINLLRASREILQMALSPSLSQLQIERLIQVRDEVVAVPRTSKLTLPQTPVTPRSGGTGGGGDAVQMLLDRAKVSPADRGKLPLGMRSNCHSLRIVLNDGRRLWYDLTVADESKPGKSMLFRVAW